MANIEADIRQLESLSNKDKNLGDVFYLNYCQAFYNIQTHTGLNTKCGMNEM